MRKIVIDGEEKFIDEVGLSDDAMGYMLNYKENDLEKTLELNFVEEDESLSDTKTNIWGDEDE